MQKTYRVEPHYLLLFLDRAKAGELTRHFIGSRLLWLVKKLNYSEAYLHTSINALNFHL